MDLTTVPASTLDMQLNTLFLAINGRLESIAKATRNPAINDPRIMRALKSEMAKVYTNVKTLNDFINPPELFIHRGADAYFTPSKTPVKTPSAPAGSGTPSYTPDSYSQGSSKNRKRLNKTLKKTLLKTLKRRVKKL